MVRSVPARQRAILSASVLVAALVFAPAFAQKMGGSGQARCEALLPLKVLNAELKGEFEYNDNIIPRTGLKDETSCKWLWGRGSDIVTIEVYWMGKAATVAYNKKVSPPPLPTTTAELLERQLKWRESVGRDKRRAVEGVGDRAALVSGAMRREIGYVQVGDEFIDFESAELAPVQAETVLKLLKVRAGRP